jgi:peptide/nickel transport system substrate-binding protein
VKIDNRKENTAGISVFATNNASQRTTTWTFHAGLTAYDAQSNLVGRLAAKIPSVSDGDWTVNPDGTMDVTWKLKPNLTWHDGAPLTSADVAFGYQMYLDPELPVQRTGGVELVSDIATPDAQTLVVHWKQAYYNANVSDLADISPVPVHILGDAYRQGDKKAFANQPYWTTDFVGVGPYRLTQWVSGSFMEGTAFDNYVLGRPKIDRVIIQINYDPNVSLASLLAGDLDVIPEALTESDRETLATRQDAFRLVQWPTSTTGAIWQWRDASAPWVGDANNAPALKVRQAMMMLLDRQQMADTFAPGGGGVANLFVAPQDPVYRLVEARGYTKYPYDPTRAAQLLGEAGWNRAANGMLQNTAGQGFPFEVRDNAPESGDTLVYIDMLRKGGIDATLYTIPANAVDRQRQRAESQGVRVGGAAISDEMMIQLTTKQIRGEANNWNGLNQGGYSNPTIDQQYERFLVEFDIGKRNEIYSDFHKFLMDQVLRIPWYYGASSVAFKNGLTGPGSLPTVLPVQTWNIHEWDFK